MWRNAVISGKVTDAAGRPIPGVTVQTLWLGIVSGVRPAIRPSRLERIPRAATDRPDRPGTYGVALASTLADGYEQAAARAWRLRGIHHLLSRRDVCRWRVSDEPERRGRTGRYRFHVDAQLTGQRGRNNRGTSAGARSPVVELCAAESQTPATNVVIAKAAVKPDGRFRFQSDRGPTCFGRSCSRPWCIRQVFGSSLKSSPRGFWDDLRFV